MHEKEAASSKSEFVGLSIDGDRGIISIKTSRLFRLRDAIHELLRRNHSSGVLLEVLLGHHGLYFFVVSSCVYLMAATRSSPNTGVTVPVLLSASGRTSGESYIKWRPSSRYATLGSAPHGTPA